MKTNLPNMITKMCAGGFICISILVRILNIFPIFNLYELGHLFSQTFMFILTFKAILEYVYLFIEVILDLLFALKDYIIIKMR
jgi:hypothetical protein